MAHCPPEMLHDLTVLFAELRTWTGLAERTPGVFYLHRRPFLHFHLLEGGRRRADIKARNDWVPVDLPYPISLTRQRAFLRQLRFHHADRIVTPLIHAPTAQRSGSRRSSRGRH
jgi:hypothetical protein